MSVIVSSDFMLRLGMHPKTNHVTRLLLLSMERMDQRGVARFDPSELLELINTEGLSTELDSQRLKALIQTGITCRYFDKGSRPNRIVVLRRWAQKVGDE